MKTMPPREGDAIHGGLGPKRVFASLSASKMWGLPSLFVAIFIALVLRVGLSQYSLWYDELASIYFSSQPLPRLWSSWMTRETNPPLYYSILHLWTELVGYGDVRLRVLSVFAGLAAIVITYFGMRKSYGYKAAALSSILLSLSAQQLFYSQQIRSYIFLYSFIAISFYGLFRVLRSEKQATIGWVLYCGGSLASVHLHTTGVVWPVTATLSLMLADRRYVPFIGSRWMHLIAADLIVLGGASWWLYITYLQTRIPNSNIGWITWPDRNQITSVLTNLLLARFASGWLKILPLLLGLLAAWGAIATWVRLETRFTVGCLFFSIALFVVLSLKQPIFLDRTFFWISIFPLVLIAAALAKLEGRWFWAVGTSIILLLAINLVRLAPKLQSEDWATPVRVLAGDPRSVALVDGESMNIALNAACAVELKLRPCPFPTVVLVRPDDESAHWAHGATRDFVTEQGVNPATPSSPNIYLVRRKLHDALSSLVSIGVLPDAPYGEAMLLGPVQPDLLTNLKSRGRWQGNFLYLDKPVPLR